MSLRKSMLQYMEQTGKTGCHAVLATYQAYQNHLNYDYFRAQMVKGGVKVPKQLATLELACEPKNETVADLMTDYINKRPAFERGDLKDYLTMKREYINDSHLTKTIRSFTNSGKIERIGKGVYLSNVAA